MKQLCKIGALAFGFFGCAGSTDPAPSAPITELPRALSAGESKVIASSNEFAFALFRTVNASQHHENVFLSPLSASMALGMTANGAEGTTYDEMHTALRLQGSRDETNEGYKSLIPLLRGLDASTDFRIANSIWYDTSLPLNPSFVDQSKTYFDASVSNLDFTNPNAVKTINGWVDASTNHRIPSILDQIQGDEVMFLINAIYFKGQWQKQFDKARTAPAPFHASDGTIGTVQMMSRGQGPVSLAYSTDYTALDMAYGNSAFTMTIVLPHEGADIDAFADSFTAEKWNAVVAGLHETSQPVWLPRFKMEWKRELNPDLASLGMADVFVSADFSRMSPLGKKLYITHVLQKTFVEVNEEGTEAAAATSVGIGVVSAPVGVRVDRPFIVAIRERFSGTILFLGKIARLPG